MESKKTIVKIIGRQSEQSTLENIFSSEEAEFVAVYGRRRVGKTFLIREFFKEKGPYFEMTGLREGSVKEQLFHFGKAFKAAFKPDFFSEKSVTTWAEAFENLKVAITRLKPYQKIVLFFDELPWLATPKSGFLNALDHFWNSWASQQKKIKLIVCGSAASWMLDKIVESKGGLHNRLTKAIRLLPFTLSETKEFLKSRGIHLNDYQILDLYLVMGGIPHYLKQVEKGLSAAQNINKICFTKDGLLAEEFHKLYTSLFENSSIHIKVMRKLAKARLGMTREELLKTTGLSSGGGTQEILRNLEEAGFIESFVPYGRQSHGKIFRVIDEYSYFYLKWIEPAPPSIFEEKNSDYWLLKQPSPSWKSWAGFAFEGICLKNIERIKSALSIKGVITENSTWRYAPKSKTDKGAQIDLLLDRADQVISICEIKHTEDPFLITKAYAEELRRKISVFKKQTQTRKTIFLVMITPYGIQKNSYSQELVNNEVTLKDLFET